MTDLVIIKRDGRKVDFDPSKIYHAVDQAMTAIGLRKVSAASNEESINTFADQVTHLVTDKIEHLQVASISVEQIQDLVEETLIEQNRSDIAKHYIVYRQQRSDAREINSSTNEMIDHILHVTSADDDDKRENGNINTDAVMGSMLKIGSSVTKNYNLAKLLNPKHVKMHRDGVIHMHDLDFMSLCANCLFIPLNKLLRDGFSTGHGFLRSPTTIRSAAALTCIAIQSSQNDMFGGQAIPSFDYYLAPYVAKSFVRHFSDYLEIITHISDTVRKEYFIRPLDAFIMKHNGIYKYRDEVKAQYDILRAQPCLEEDKNVDTEQQFTDAWKYAERKTIQETHQAMEALTHNLCSMQCFPGYEDLWVYDRLANQWCIFTFAELHRKFTLGRYSVLSVNQSTGAVEMKGILDCVARDNDKRMISIADASGAGYVSTYDHRYMTSNPDATLGYTPAIDASHTTMPRGFTIPTLNHDTGMEIFSNYDAEVTTFIPYSQELAELLGYFVADGWTTTDSLVIGFNANSEVNPVHIAELFHVVFGVEAEQQITDGSSSIYPEHNRDLVIHCDLYIARYIEKLCGQNIYSRHVPNFVLTGEENYQNSFTRAFFSNAIDSGTFATNSSSLIYDMRLMSLANNRLLTVNMTNVTTDPTEPAVHRYVGSIKDAGADLRSSDVSGIRVFNESIVSKTDAPDAEIVYDISVRDNENFMLANGAIVHNSRAGSQTPFSSVNFGLDTSWEGRLISSEVLDAGYAGLGHGETALFPITIFKMKKGVNDKGSPNYDLFQKACKVTALRMLPNFVNVDAPFNLEYYQPDRPETHIATMGCVHGTETSLWKLDDKIEVSDFGRMSRILMNKYPLIRYSAISFYMDLEKVDIGIWDSFNNKFAKVKKFIINQNITDWVIVKLDDESTLTITPDHPLPVEGRGRIRADELKRGDRIKHSINEKLYTGSDEFATVLSIEKASIGSISETTSYSYDVETDTDRFDLDSIFSFNCRTRVLSNVYDKNHVQTDGRGNLFWTTINMPYLALEAKEQAGDIITNFFRRLDEVIDDVIDFSHDRFNIIAHRKAYNFPFLMGQHEYVGSDELLPDGDIREVIKNGTIAIGFIGLAETLLTLVGKHHGESDEAQALGLKIIQHMKDRADRQTKLENINYSVMGSPAEGCTGRLCKAIKKRWGVIPGITDKPYLVNSTHVPPSYKTTLVHKVEIEAPYHALCLGGHIWYGEIDANTAANVEAVERIVTYIASKGCGYFSLNHPMMRDPICGYVGAPAPDGSCPRCGRKEFEGVAAWKLLQLRSYSPDPEYLVRSDMITYEDTMPEPNSLEGLSVED